MVSKRFGLIGPGSMNSAADLCAFRGSLPTTKGPKCVYTLHSGARHSTMIAELLLRRLKAAAEVEELKDKIAQLEAALQTMQAKVSPDEPHPLLQPAQLPANSSPSDSSSGASPPGSSAPSSSSTSSQSPPSDPSQEEEQEVLDTFGTVPFFALCWLADALTSSIRNIDAW